MRDHSTKYSYHLHTRKRFRHHEQDRLRHSVTLHPYVLLSTSLTSSFVGTFKLRDTSSCTAVEVAFLLLYSKAQQRFLTNGTASNLSFFIHVSLGDNSSSQKESNDHRVEPSRSNLNGCYFWWWMMRLSGGVRGEMIGYSSMDKDQLTSNGTRIRRTAYVT